MSPLDHLASRVHAIEPFRVMEVVKAAAALRQEGVDVISMSVGEPDFTAAPRVAAAAIAAIEAGASQYTDALGLATLRAAIAAHYLHTCGLTIDPRRIVVTAGASAGLLLACAALVGEGDEVLMPDPCGRPAARVRGIGGRRRRSTDARSVLPMQPPFRHGVWR
jgi:aspartate/methionine/tyrosine aminotransferase